jgi:hypothetical protein
MKPSLPIDTTARERGRAGGPPSLHRRTSPRKEERDAEDQAEMMRAHNTTVIDVQKASPNDLRSASARLRQWLAADAWARSKMFERTTLSQRGKACIGSTLRKRKPDGKNDVITLIGQSTVNAGHDRGQHRDAFTWMATRPKTPPPNHVWAPTPSNKGRKRGKAIKSARAKKRRSSASEDIFPVSKKQLKDFHVHTPLSMSVDGSHMTMDFATNSVITIKFTRRMTDDIQFGFTVKNACASLTGHMSSLVIFPIVHTVQTPSEAAQAGVRTGMRIIGVGKTTIHPCSLMPSSSADYSPARHCKQMIVDAIHSSNSVNIRVDTRH